MTQIFLLLFFICENLCHLWLKNPMAAFVGREQDLETVDRYFQEAAQGKGSVVFITGEAGIGKTTFINEFKARYVDAQNAASKKKNAPDIRFAEAKCSELIGKGEAYAPFIELIGRLVADDKAFGSSKLADVVREIGADWFELVPVIGKALKLVSTTFFKWQSADDARQLADRKGNKEKLVQQYVQILKTMSEKHPLVLFVDDLHWADDSSIYLLFQLAREIQDRRILILGTYRPTDIQAARGEKAHPLKDALGEMHRFGVCKEVKLGYFTPDHIRRYLDAVFPQNRLDAAFVAYLHDLTEGNPLFVTEQVKLLQEIGKIAPAQTSEVSKTSEVLTVWELRGTLRDADMPIPTSVEKTIEKRFERLKEDMQETLQYASINGEQFDAAVVAQMLQQDELTVLKKLQTLDRVYQFVAEQKTDGRPTRGAVYQFIHSLVQKSLYGTLSDGLKVKLHAKAAEIIETLYPEQREAFAEELAAHWERGREYAKAAQYLLLAARKANRQSGYQEAKAHAQRGLEMLKSAGFSAVETRDGRTPHVETHGRASLPITPDQAMLRVQIELLLELATAEEAIGEAKISIEHGELAASLVESINDQRLQGNVFEQVGQILRWNSEKNWEVILNFFDKALLCKIATNDYEHSFKLLETMYWVYFSLGKRNDFLTYCQNIIQTSQKSLLHVAALKMIAMIFFDQGKYQNAYENIVNSLNLAVTIENVNSRIELLTRAVQYAIRLDNLTVAIEHYNQARSIVYTEEGNPSQVALLFELGWMAWHLKKYEETFEHWERGQAIAYKNSDLEMASVILLRLMQKLRSVGKFEKSLEYGMKCLEVRKKLGRVRDIEDIFHSLSFSFRHQGDYLKCLEMRQNTISLSRQYGRFQALAGSLSSYAIDLIIMGQFKEAMNVYQEALPIFQKNKDLLAEVDCLTGSAVCHFSLGRNEQSLSLITQALSLQKKPQSKDYSMLLSMRHSQILLGLGKYKQASILLENIVDEWTRTDSLWGDVLVIYLTNPVKLAIAFDKIDYAFSLLRQIEAFFKRIVMMEGIAKLKDAYAQVYLAQGDLEQATASVNEAIALFQQMNSFRLGEAYVTLAAIELAQRQPAAALQHAVDAGNIFKAIEYYRYGETVLMEARAHFALKQYADMQTRLKAAAAEFKRLQQPHHLAEAQLLHGQMLAAAGQPEKALQNMISAKKTFAKLGLKRLENEAERVISRISHTKESRKQGE